MIDTDAAGDITGSLSFRQAEYVGDARVHASDAAARIEGPMVADAAARVAVVTIYERTLAVVDTSEVVRLLRHATGPRASESYQFDDALIRISGETDGVFQVWPDDAPSTAKFELQLDAQNGSRIFASPTTSWFRPYDANMEHSYLLEAPVFAVAHERSRPEAANLPGVRFADATFEHLHASGNLKLVVENADIAIDHAEGTATFQVRTGSDALEPVPMVGARKVSYAVITIATGSVDLAFENTDAVLLARDPFWESNGTVTLGAEEGHLRSGETQRPLEDDEVRIDGNATFRLRAEGEHDGQRQIGNVRTPDVAELSEEPRVNAALDTDSDNVTVSGRPFAPAAVVAPAIPEKATVVAMILGLLLLAWTASKQFLVFLGGMVHHDPLKSPRRRQIHALLKRTGMAHLNEIQRATKIPLGSLHYHMAILHRANVVASVRRSGYRVYFLPSRDFCRDEVQRLALLADPTRRRISEALANCTPLSQRDLQERLGASRSSISRQLALLEDEGCVEHQGDRNRLYHATPLVRRWLGRCPAT